MLLRLSILICFLWTLLCAPGWFGDTPEEREISILGAVVPWLVLFAWQYVWRWLVTGRVEDPFKD
jgi:hypothetical protein